MQIALPESPLGHFAIIIPAVLFAVIAAIEWFRPRRADEAERKKRWATHAGFFLANAVTAQLLAFLVIVPIAAGWAQANNFGLLYWIDVPGLWSWIIAFILLDFAVWFQHVLMHRIPILWRIHAVHHGDTHLDLTTALRFHPMEIIVSTLYKSAWVALLGVPVLVALAFELWLNGNAIFNHSNIRLPRWLDRILRPFIVTPNMHLVHHSTYISDQQRNYGFALTIWDRLFGQYLARSASGIEDQPIGLAEAQDERPTQFFWSIAYPFRNVS